MTWKLKSDILELGGWGWEVLGQYFHGHMRESREKREERSTGNNFQINYNPFAGISFLFLLGYQDTLTYQYDSVLGCEQ